jgi:TetR/AcrR family transcriptional regulator
VGTAGIGSGKIEDAAARERLLRAALDLFDRKGYATTTVREIVEAAGVTKPVLYYYFGNKEGIYLALMGEAFSDFNRLLASAGGTGDLRIRLLDLCTGAYSLAREKLPLVRVMYAIYYGPPQGAPAFDFDAVHAGLQDRVRQIIQEGTSSGELRSVPVQDAIWAIVGAINIAIEVDLCHPEQSLGCEGLRRILNLVFDGISATTHSERGKRP